ncbi:MAG: hypothetical protein HKN00_08665 [Flavobacteriaceae bacterium]|nr:hypothetical protein [Bacteroidia bacterium]MBT8286749.1 hypothetical protein [Bacteroidia bacterium]NNF75240.1 hypothetical protein [Flavobacteriaceae bacterium]NNK74203.1 hypothetical protein [Flavobacteriaceae bacterium]
MKNRIDQQLDKLSREIIAKGGLQQPTADFKSNVMYAIERLPREIDNSYDPILSKTAWVLIVLCIMGSSALIYFMNVESTGLMNEILETLRSANTIEWSFRAMSWSSPIVYAVVIMGGLTAIQFSWLKGKYQNSLGV